MTDARRLIEKHRSNGVIVDSNLLLLLVIGSTNENRVPQFDRTQQYTVDDFRLLQEIVAECRSVLTTPHVLTEVSNLAKLRNPELSKARAKLREISEATEEFYEPSRHVMADATFVSFGLTDAAIRLIADRPALVLTDDLPLFHYLSRKGLDAINFNHLRVL